MTERQRTRLRERLKSMRPSLLQATPMEKEMRERLTHQTLKQVAETMGNRANKPEMYQQEMGKLIVREPRTVVKFSPKPPLSMNRRPDSPAL